MLIYSRLFSLFTLSTKHTGDEAFLLLRLVIFIGLLFSLSVAWKLKLLVLLFFLILDCPFMRDQRNWNLLITTFIFLSIFLPRELITISIFFSILVLREFSGYSSLLLWCVDYIFLVRLNLWLSKGVIINIWFAFHSIQFN